MRLAIATAVLGFTLASAVQALTFKIGEVLALTETPTRARRRNRWNG